MSTPDSDHPPAATGTRDVKSAARTVELLELLAARDRRWARLRELSGELGVPRSSLYALLRTLVARGWVRTDATGTMYAIGIRALLAGTNYLDTDPYLRLVQPHLDELSEQLDETFHLARLDGPDVVYLATKESSQYLRPFSRVGRRVPAYATALGRALLAERDLEEALALLPEPLPALTAYTVTETDAVVAELDRTRTRGYAEEREESVIGLCCFGFALRYAAPATDALSCSVPTARLTPELERTILAAMSDVRRRIEAAAPP